MPTSARRSTRPRGLTERLEANFAGPLPYYGALAFLAIGLLAGGASRLDTFAQIIIEVVAVAMLALSLAVTPLGKLRDIRGPLLFCAAIVASVAIQIVPLPPALWTALPGRDFYAQAAPIAGIEQPWRPISLAPELTFAALAGLVVPVAALLIWFSAGPKRGTAYLNLLLAGLAVTLVLGLAQMAGGDSSPLRFYSITNRESPVGLFANRNHQAILLAIGLPMLATWTRLDGRSGGRRRRRNGPDRGLIALIAAVLLLPMILLTGSRAGIVLALIGIGASIPLLRFRKSEVTARQYWILGAAGLCIVAAIFFTIYLSRAVAIDRLVGIDLTLEKRNLVLAPATEMIRTFFPFGSGVGTFDAAFRRFEPFNMLTLQYFNQAHNDGLQLLIETGVFGLCALVAYLIWWVGRLRVLLRRSASPRPELLMGRLGAVVTSMILIASLSEYALRTPFFAILFVFGSLWMREGAAGRDTAVEGAYQPLPPTSETNR